MEDIAFLENPLNVYLLKQNEFKKYVKEIQYFLNSKEYIKQDYTLDEYIKLKWKISKTQAYRYLICAKTLDQLEEFEIQPNYERLCRSLNKYAKTAQQMKLLWGTILNKINKNVDLITSPLVTKTWDELCKDKKYSNICNFEDSILTKIENKIKNYSKKSKQNQLKSNINNNAKPNNYKPQNQNEINSIYLISPENSSIIYDSSSQSINIPSNDHVYNENININQFRVENQTNNTLYSNYSIYSPLSSISSLSLTTQNNEMNNTFLPIEYSNSQYQNINQITPKCYTNPTQKNIIYY